jgi:hypothetical protein
LWKYLGKNQQEDQEGDRRVISKHIIGKYVMTMGKRMNSLRITSKSGLWY